MAIKGLSDSGGGSLSSLYGGLNYAIEKGAKISSNSWGGRGNDGGSLADILANNPEHLFIAAAGNDNEQISESNQFVTGSTNAANQIVVGATTDNDARSWFSNYGKPYVHVMAPGSAIMSTLPGSAYGNLSGTSMACPQVSGLAALIMTMRDISGAQLKQLIEANVQQKSQYTDFVTTGGLIDVLATVQAAAGDDSTPSPPDDSVCIDIKIRTEAWGDENSWTFGSCSSSQSYDNYQDYTEECCQPAGSYALTCKCSYGDGWHDGYIQIETPKSSIVWTLRTAVSMLWRILPMVRLEVTFASLSRPQHCNGEMRTRGHLALAPPQLRGTSLRERTKRNAANLLEVMIWFAMTLMETDGMEDMFRLATLMQSCARTSLRALQRLLEV